MVGLLLFLIYINNSLDSLSSMFVPFADDICLLSKVHENHESRGNFTKVLKTLKEFGLQIENEF